MTEPPGTLTPGGSFRPDMKGMTAMFSAASRIPNGTVLLMGITYPGSAAKEFTYALLKAGGLWYVTGSGKVPTAAGWGAIERWLAKDNRQLNWVKAVTETAVIWPEVALPESTLMAQLVGATPSLPGKDTVLGMIQSGELRRDYSD